MAAADSRRRCRAPRPRLPRARPSTDDHGPGHRRRPRGTRPVGHFCGVGGFALARYLLVSSEQTLRLGSLEDGPPPDTNIANIVRRVKRSLQDSPELRRLCVANYAYWATLAGASMTVLPLVLATDLGGLQALGPGQIGALFAGQACISVVGAVPAASLADKYGPATMIPPALLVYAAAFGALPFASEHSYEAVACAMALQACGSCLLGSAPSAAAVNAVPDKDRAAALAALRVCGDVGLLTGAAALGGVAAWAGTDAAFFCALLAWWRRRRGSGGPRPFRRNFCVVVTFKIRAGCHWSGGSRAIEISPVRVLPALILL